MRHFKPPAPLGATSIEAALRVAEPLFEAAHLGLWLVDLASGALWWSRLTRRIHETGPRFEPTLEQALAFYPPEARAGIEAVIDEARATGRSWDQTHPIETARGRRLLLRSCGLAIPEGGETRWLAGTCEDVTEETSRNEEHARLALVVRQMTNAAIIADPEGRTVWANQAFERLTGYRLADFVGRKPGHLLQGPDTDPETVAAIARALSAGEPFAGEIRNYRADGTPYWIELSISPVRDPEGALTGFVGIESDVTARRKAQQEAAEELAARRDAEELLREIIDAVPIVLSVYDRRDRFLMGNRALRETFPRLAPLFVPGTPLETLVRAWFCDQMPERCSSPEATDRLVGEAMASLQGGFAGVETRLPDGRWLHSSVRRTATGHLIWVRTDITALKQAEIEARERASRDPLTGLLNRSGFMGLLEARAKAHARQHRGVAPSGCLLVLDIDHFKSVNDVYGHAAGDRLLQAVAGRLQRAIRKTDLAARLGGDEFALFLCGAGPDDARARVEQIIAAAARATPVGPVRLIPSLSVGAAIASQDGADCDTLLRHADRALYEAKRLGRNRAVFYADRLAEELADRRRLAERLRRALATDRVEVALQPQLRIADGAIIGFEALARWTDAGQPVPPLAFVAAAEEHGLAERLGRAVMACALAAAGSLRRATGQPIRVSVNVSTAQLLAEDFADQVLAQLKSADLPPQALELEITETVFLDRSFARISSMLDQLRGLGIRLALDDFGTGHASLSHLGTLSVDCLKIDRSFVEAIGVDRRRELIARTIIGLARGLELECVAEGVETRQQLRFLESHGCNLVQGYLVGRPVALEEACALLRRRPDRRVPVAGIRPAGARYRAGLRAG
jgi:diguanylate cyclase (GGDEF)-like protein/PAS domain S-box-containing protein